MLLPAELAFQRTSEELKDIWQGRLLTHTHGPVRQLMMSILAHSWPDHVNVLFMACIPDFVGIERPFFSSCGRIMKDGTIVADVMPQTGGVQRRQQIFKSEESYQTMLRLIADKLKFTDPDRVEFFAKARAWLVADFRVGPNGQRIA